MSKSISQAIKSKLKSKQLTVININKVITHHRPPPPHITTTLQAEAWSKYHFSPKKTMRIAQKLYEGKKINNQVSGIITYMRTDSYRLSVIFKEELSKYIVKNYGESYLAKSRFYQNKSKNTQDGHEAIRPTDISQNPNLIRKFLTSDENKIYELIFNRTLASLMTSQNVETTNWDLETNSEKFTYSQSTSLFDGFKKITKTKTINPEFNFKVGDQIKIQEFIIDEHETSPPLSYNIAGLIKEMEKIGIGRPSTYAIIIDVLLERSYLKLETSKLIPTKLGVESIAALEKYFPLFIDLKYTARLEDELDQIAAQKKTKLEIMEKFYDPMTDHFNKVWISIKDIKNEQVTTEFCPECQSKLIRKKGRYGLFLACSKYPNCQYTKSESENLLPGLCPSCQSKTLIKKKTKRNRQFISCKNYPSCQYATWNLKKHKV